MKTLLFLIASLATYLTSMASGRDLTLNDIYRHPFFWGSAPTGGRWSPDGKTIAFLWNDHGDRFNDLWIYNLQSRELTRMT